MGGSSSKPDVVLGPTSTIKDTTLRSVIFNQKDLEFVKSPSGQMILKTQVTPEKFQEYENVLRMMARLSRLVYSDSGIIRKVLLDPEFTVDNRAVNDAITKYDKEFAKEKREKSTAPGSIDGRPMQSYLIDLLPAKPTAPAMCHYVSSPADLTFFILRGDKAGLLPTDAVLVFKGSSTVDNFKHDLMSQFTPVALETKLPPGLKMTSTVTGNTVCGSFLNQITDSWEFLDAGLKSFNPTRLFVSGHSLGGAYATLFTFILAEARAAFPSIKSVHLITMGSPTVMTDMARNTFNTHLDSGFVTLDRVVSTGTIMDFVPSIPAIFSHPGFQPLRTELYPEKTTGRAYNFDTIKKVFMTGGAIVLGFTQAKRDYGQQTLTHAPNLVKIKTNFNPFAHAGYFDMTWLGAFRLMGMKNPGFGTNTFTCDIYPEGVSFGYSAPTTPASTPPVSDPNDSKTFESLAKESPKQGGRRTYRKGKKLRKTRRSLK